MATACTPMSRDMGSISGLNASSRTRSPLVTASRFHRVVRATDRMGWVLWCSRQISATGFVAFNPFPARWWVSPVPSTCVLSSGHPVRSGWCIPTAHSRALSTPSGEHRIAAHGCSSSDPQVVQVVFRHTSHRRIEPSVEFFFSGQEMPALAGHGFVHQGADAVSCPNALGVWPGAVRIFDERRPWPVGLDAEGEQCCYQDSEADSSSLSKTHGQGSRL
ncbi:MAG: hypothetical protein KatS3mg082_2125 [Nitrospiraceae bacterium]|nr:MAG: hypothetical protein KatS3mg082_2125 [Nitrospiraceae bacterium]